MGRSLLFLSIFALLGSALKAQDVSKTERNWEAIADSLNEDVGLIMPDSVSSLDSLRNDGALCDGYFGKISPDGNFSGVSPNLVNKANAEKDISIYKDHCIKIISTITEKLDSNTTYSLSRFTPLFIRYVDVRPGQEKKVLWLELHQYNPSGEEVHDIWFNKGLFTGQEPSNEFVHWVIGTTDDDFERDKELWYKFSYLSSNLKN